MSQETPPQQSAPGAGAQATEFEPSLCFRQRPFPRGEPDLVAGEPAPGGLDGENASELAGVPAAGDPGASLAPKTQRLPLQHVRTRFEWSKHACFRWPRRVSRKHARFELIKVVHRSEPLR